MEDKERVDCRSASAPPPNPSRWVRPLLLLLILAPALHSRIKDEASILEVDYTEFGIQNFGILHQQPGPSGFAALSVSARHISSRHTRAEQQICVGRLFRKVLFFVFCLLFIVFLFVVCCLFFLSVVFCFLFDVCLPDQATIVKKIKVSTNPKKMFVVCCCLWEVVSSWCGGQVMEAV